MSTLAPVVEELFTARFQAVVEEMGELLRRTALSTNVKERLDFSCALLGPGGELVANAPHMPVHLGALGACVRAVVAELPLGPGDVAVTNSPAFAGSHLPDVTVISPVYEKVEVDDPGALVGYVASRAHHAEIGGTRPGSMPPEATTLEEEGVVLEPFRLVEAGEPRFDRLEERLRGACHPSRSVPENLADVEAAVAAGHRGAAGLRALAAAHGRDVVAEQMALLARRAGRRVAAALGRLIPAGEDSVRLSATEHLDDGTPLAVAFTITRVEETGGGVTAASAASAHVSFEGSGPVHPGNLNTTRAVVRSALLYVLRLLVDEPLPLNEGLLGPVTLEIPSPTILDPFGDRVDLDPSEAPAVVGGNTETSQRIVDTLCRALGVAAGSQGTMNNTLFGNDRFGYYETVCGGSGATPEGPGASAVHTHMTNTRITDPEILERRYPVRLERFAVRRGSGGAGRHRGGDGAVREITFLEELELSVLGQHRQEGPYGLAGGRPGAKGRVRLVRGDTGDVEELTSVDGRTVRPGDRLLTETPGGGGWGSPADGGEGDDP